MSRIRVCFLVLFLLFTVAFGFLFHDSADAQDETTVPATDMHNAEVGFDFRIRQGVASAPDGVRSANGLLISGNSGEGSIVSDSIVVPLAVPEPFFAVGMVWIMPSVAEDLEISVRGSEDGDSWGEWQHFEELLYTGNEYELASDLQWFDPSIRYVQYQISWSRAMSVTDTIIEQVRIAFISPGVTPSEARDIEPVQGAPEFEVVTQAYPQPAVTSRTGWGCPTGQSSPAWGPEYTTVTHLIVHHTVTPNTDTDWPARVRAIWEYHTNTLGWGDIGYNYLIDPNGTIYEGRAGGDNVIGAHFSCVNSGTMGVALLGDFSSTSPTSAARQSLERLLAWKTGQRGLSPQGSSFHNASQLALMTISGHRDGNTSPVGCPGATVCPGNTLYGMLPTIRANVSSLTANYIPGAPRIIAPANAQVIANTLNYEIRLQPGSLSGRPGEVTDYYVKIDDNPAFSSVNFQAGWTTSTTITINQQLPDGVYYIRAWQGDGTTSGPAANSMFIVSSAPLTRIYEATFASTAGAEWSRTNTTLSPTGSRRFLGDFGNLTTALRLSNLPSHSAVYVTFDAYLLRSWDGTNGSDNFMLETSEGLSLLNSTFSNSSSTQSFPSSSAAARTGAAEVNTLGYMVAGAPMDSVYRIGAHFDHTRTSLMLRFAASGLSGASWGLDNVRVYLDTRPANDTAATAQLFGAVPNTMTQTNIAQATISASDPSTCGGILQNTVWYRLRSNSSQTLTMTTAGSSYDTVLAVYSGTETNLTPVVCSDDMSTSDQTSSITFNAGPAKTYYLLVGKYGASLTSPATLMLNVTSAPLLVHPVLRSPGADATVTNRTPILRWYAVSGADHYELALGRSAVPTNLVYTGSGLSYQPSAALLPTTYYWRLRSIAPDGTPSPWSNPRRLIIEAVSGDVPQQNFFETSVVTLSWNSITWATDYEVQTSTAPTFNNGSQRSVVVSASQLSITIDSYSNGLYYWRVRARRTDGSWGMWSVADTFRVDIP